MRPEKLFPEERPCKCCEQTANLYDVCDFNKNCEEANGFHLPLSGIPVYYYKCGHCGFIFTDRFDRMTTGEIKEAIYNDDYLRVDPDYASLRPESNAQLIENSFSEAKNEIRILDYGGGNGMLARALERKDFREVETYDPFYKKYAEKPTTPFNLIISFEVIEHVPDPRGTCMDMISLLDKDNGLILFSTLLAPGDVDNVKTAWWYIAPRNGHISIHTPKSLDTLWRDAGFHFVSANQNLHFAFKRIPDFAAHIFKVKK